MRRRDFLQLASSAAAAWPMPALAQQPSSLPLVAVLEPKPAYFHPKRPSRSCPSNQVQDSTNNLPRVGRLPQMG